MNKTSVCPNCWTEVAFPVGARIRCPACRYGVTTEPGKEKETPLTREEIQAEQEAKAKGGRVLAYGASLLIFSVLVVCTILTVKYFGGETNNQNRLEARKNAPKAELPKNNAPVVPEPPKQQIEIQPPPSEEKKQEPQDLQFVKKGNQAMEDGDEDLALSFFNSAIAVNPNSAEGYLGKGWAYSKKNLHIVAVDNYTRAIRIDPNQSKPYLYRAISYLEREKYKNAIEDCNRYDKIDNGKYSSREWLCTYSKTKATGFAQAKNLVKAYHWFQKAILFQPNDYDALRKSGLSAMLIYDYDNAINYLTKAAKINSSSNKDLAQAYFIRAKYHYDRENDGRAFADYNMATKYDPSLTSKKNLFRGLFP